MKRLLPCVASLVMPGLGQLMCGRALRAAVMALIYWGLLTFQRMGLVFAVAPLTFGLYAGMRLLVIFVNLAIAVDAWALGRHNTPEKRPGAAQFAAFGIMLVILPNALLLWARSHVLPRAFEIGFPFQSMSPGIVPGDILVVQTTNGPFQSGDLAYITEPEVSVRRIIGTPDDLVSIDKGDVIRDAHTLTEPYISQRTVGDMVPTMVLAGRYFVLADNRNDPAAHDSRTYGSVPGSALHGRPLFVLWSSDLHRIGQRLR